MILFLFCSSLSYGQSRSEIDAINTQAISILSENLKQIMGSYSAYSGGYTNREHFMKNKSMQDYKNIIDQNVEFRINVPNKYRNLILDKGYLNQHQTGTTNGCLCTSNRNSKEAAMVSWPGGKYGELSSYIKPKYGSMGIAGVNLYGVVQYGDDVYILDESKLKNRISYTLADSLGITKDHFNNQNPLFIPFEFKELLLGKLAKSSLSNAGSQIYMNSYTEIQIWGVLRLEHLKEFRFTKTPPDDAISAFLLQNGIRIRQIICSGDKIGDESCLKDYLSPTISSLIGALKKNDESVAQKEAQSIIDTGVNLLTVYSSLPKERKTWFLSELQKSKNLKNQKIDSWFTFLKHLQNEKVDTNSLKNLILSFGDAEKIISYYIDHKLSEKDLDVAFAERLILSELSLDIIKKMSDLMPEFSKIIQKNIEQKLTVASTDGLRKVSSSVLFSFLSAKVSAQQVALIFMERIFKNENPFTILSFMPIEARAALLKNLGQCISKNTCPIAKGFSGTFLALFYSEILKETPTAVYAEYLWLQYFSELADEKTYKNQPSIVDIVNYSREKKNSAQRFYVDLLEALKAQPKPFINPLEVAVEIEKDRKELKSDLIADLGKIITAMPNRAVIFPEAGLKAPIIPTYYYVIQIRGGHLKTSPDIYPLDSVLAKLVERSIKDINTNTYRLISNNIVQVFQNQKDLKSQWDETYASIDEVVPSFYRYILMQTHYRLTQIIQKDSGEYQSLLEADLNNWFGLSEEQRQIYIEGLDVVPLLIIEKIGNVKITKDYLERTKTYLNSPEYLKLSNSEDFLKFVADRKSWSNIFNNKTIANTVDEFNKKFLQMSSALK